MIQPQQGIAALFWRRALRMGPAAGRAWKRTATGFLFFVLATPALFSLRAQSALYELAADGGLRPVKTIVNPLPFLNTITRTRMIHDSKYPLYGETYENETAVVVLRQYALRPTEYFYPAFVRVADAKGVFSNQEEAPEDYKYRVFHFSARLSSDSRLETVILVLEFDTQNESDRIYASEIPADALKRGAPVSLEIEMRWAKATRYELHLFSEGREMLNSTLPRATIAAAWTKLAGKKITGATNASARPMTGPMPAYPGSIGKKRPAGRAVVSCIIAPTGEPQEVKLKSASDPVFGDAALAVMPEWWFLPKVVDGKAVASAAELPFEFTPPK